MSNKNVKKVRIINPKALPIIGSLQQRPASGELHITYKTCLVHKCSIMDCGCWKKGQ